MGSATITATQAGVSGTTTVTVTAAVLTSITITPPEFFYRQGYQRTTYCDREFLGRHDPESHRVRDLGFLRWVNRNGQQCSR